MPVILMPQQQRESKLDQIMRSALMGQQMAQPFVRGMEMKEARRLQNEAMLGELFMKHPELAGSAIPEGVGPDGQKTISAGSPFQFAGKTFDPGMISRARTAAEEKAEKRSMAKLAAELRLRGQIGKEFERPQQFEATVEGEDAPRLFEKAGKDIKPMEFVIPEKREMQTVSQELPNRAEVELGSMDDLGASPMDFGGASLPVQKEVVTPEQRKALFSGKKSASQRPITKTEETKLFAKAGKYGVDPQEFTSEDGSTVNHNALAVAVAKAEKAATPLSKMLNPSDKKLVDNLATSNAGKISISNQLKAGIETFQDTSVGEEIKAVEAQRLLKILNSTEGKDALQEAEREALGPFTTFSVADFKAWFGDPTKRFYGRDLNAFLRQLQTASKSVDRSVQLNEQYINNIYGKYDRGGSTSSPVATPKINPNASGKSPLDDLRNKYLKP